MSTLIAYAGKTGTTQKAVDYLKKALPGAKSANLQKGTPGIGDFDIVIIGGPVRMNRLPKEVRSFIRMNKDALAEKKLGLFICCGSMEKTQEILEDVYSSELRNHATIVAGFGGEINYDRLKGFEKLFAKIVDKRMAKDPNAIRPYLDTEAIDKFAVEISK